MASTEVMSTYIKKLSHPLKEIRERSLQLLAAKLCLGWELEDELASTRDVLEALLAWFDVRQPTLQREALQLLLSTIKTKAGTYISREFGIKKILSTLNRAKSKLEPDAIEMYNDVLDTLKFLNTVESQDNVGVPPLSLHSLAGSECDEVSSSSGYYNIRRSPLSSKETSVSIEDAQGDRPDLSQTKDGIRVLLFPWVELGSSDAKTILLVEDALQLLKSTRRCCRFICDVFLRDFPAEIFLNRPNIIKSLLSIADGGNSSRPGDALNVLLCITSALRMRLRQLSTLDLVHDTSKVSPESRSDNAVDEVNVQLTQMAGDASSVSSNDNDTLAALRQLPAPVFALDTLHAVLTLMAKSIALLDPVDKSEILDLKDTNTCISLVECLIKLLLDCVSEKFWCIEHSSKTHRDIAHKGCMVMRGLGDLLTKYRKSFFEETSRRHHRIAWLRLVPCAEELLSWARHSGMPLSTLVIALQAALLDPALDLFYPELNKRISEAIHNSKTSVDPEYKSKYRELTKLYASMEEATQFIKNTNSCRSSKKVFDVIKKSLPVLELHLSEAYLNDVSDIVFKKTKHFDMNDNDWCIARGICLKLMAHNLEWVQARFYRRMVEMVRSVLVADDANQVEDEKCLALLCDVGMLTEICCHGINSESKEVQACASDVMLYLVRGRLVLSEGCWWRLLASLLPVLPLLHVYAAHDKQLGQAICKSLDGEIAQCMGVSQSEVTTGLVRLLFVTCPSVQLDAAYELCRLLHDESYLPPKESLRVDVLMNALDRLEPQEFNVDYNSSPSKVPTTTGLMQILDVLKQDIVHEDHTETSRPYMTPTLEPSLRRSTLQQLSVILRQQDLHDTFIQSDGIRVIMATLRMSMQVDDYLAFPECAISCVSVLNSVCFTSRHTLAKIPDLPLLLLRVILVFPANDSAVLMSAQVLALVAWSGFVLQELDESRRRVPALPFSVTSRTKLPFVANSYWNTSPNVEHSSVEWLMSEEETRAAVRMRWWCSVEGAARVVRGAPPPAATPARRPPARDVAALRLACPAFSCAKALLDLENATAHRQVNEALVTLESYTHLLPLSLVTSEEFGALPWQHTRRFLCAPPASSRDTALLISLLRFIVSYMDNVPNDYVAMSWIKSSFIGDDVSVISLLSRNELYIEQTAQESIEVTQLHSHIVKVLRRCVILLEYDSDYDSGRMESLLKILLACLERVDLKNFHMLGYLNELVRCIRYAVNSRYCKLSEDTLVQCLRLTTATLAGCAAGGGRKGHACRLDALVTLLALLKQIQQEAIPVQTWSESWSGEAVRAVAQCCSAARPELRAAALYVIAALAHHVQMMPHLVQAISADSLSEYAASMFTAECEANVVRSGAAAVLTAVTARHSPHTDILESEILEHLRNNNFLENCVDILVDFCNNERGYCTDFEPNVPRSVFERRSALEVLAQKNGDTVVSPRLLTYRGRPPSTATLVAAAANVLYNVGTFSRCPVPAWSDHGLYRLLFRCASWSKGNASEIQSVRLSSCRVLAAASAHKCVRVSLATTKDCLLGLLATLTPFDDDETDSITVEITAHALLLLAWLLPERAASDTIWRALRDSRTPGLLSLLLQCLRSQEIELQDAASQCLSQLVQSSSHNKHPDKTKDESRIEFFDNVKSPFAKEVSSERGTGRDCQPEYMAEELCKALADLYQKLSVDIKIFAKQDERWHRLCSCFSSVLSTSPRCRQYGVHRQLPQLLLATLQAIRDRLSLQGSADALKSAAQNPTLRALQYLLVLMDCQMLNCSAAKEAFAENGIAVSLNRLWPWCMLTEELRDAVMHLLFTFSNECPKAWCAMSSCVGGRNLVCEVCAVCAREAALQSRARSSGLLLLAIRTLHRTVAHHQCRTIILKSEVIVSIYKARVRERAWSVAGGAWARLVERTARWADGAAALLLLRPLLAAPPVRALLLPALAHLARHRRQAVLQAPDLLELLSGTLLSGDMAEIVSAARAVWALAANNHKAKLLLRSAGVVASLQSALQTAQRMATSLDTQRATQLLLYVNTVLQTT